MKNAILLVFGFLSLTAIAETGSMDAPVQDPDAAKRDEFFKENLYNQEGDRKVLFFNPAVLKNLEENMIKTKINSALNNSATLNLERYVRDCSFSDSPELLGASGESMTKRNRYSNTEIVKQLWKHLAADVIAEAKTPTRLSPSEQAILTKLRKAAQAEKKTNNSCQGLLSSSAEISTTIAAELKKMPKVWAAPLPPAPVTAPDETAQRAFLAGELGPQVSADKAD